MERTAAVAVSGSASSAPRRSAASRQSPLSKARRATASSEGLGPRAPPEAEPERGAKPGALVPPPETEPEPGAFAPAPEAMPERGAKPGMLVPPPETEPEPGAKPGVPGPRPEAEPGALAWPPTEAPMAKRE